MVRHPKHKDYGVTKSGKVFSFKRGRNRRLKACINREGYKYLNLDYKFYFVHKLVLTLYVGPRPEGMECRHKDGNPANNNLSNIEWSDRVTNAQDRNKHGTMCRGNKHPKYKLSPEDVKHIQSFCSFFGRGSSVKMAKLYKICHAYALRLAKGLDRKEG